MVLITTLSLSSILGINTCIKAFSSFAIITLNFSFMSITAVINYDSAVVVGLTESSLTIILLPVFHCILFFLYCSIPLLVAAAAAAGVACCCCKEGERKQQQRRRQQHEGESGRGVQAASIYTGKKSRKLLHSSHRRQPKRILKKECLTLKQKKRT